MTSRSQLGGASVVTSMVSSLTAANTNFSFSASSANAVTALSGSMTGGALKTAYSATGRGRINFFAVGTNDATSRTVRVRVTVNGTVVFDKTTAPISASNAVVAAIGSANTNTSGNPVSFQPIDYTNGVLVEFASSLTETDKLTTAINAEVRQ